MGNDGGSIPTRRELVKEGAREVSTTQVKEIQTEQQEHYWSTCALSHQPLAEPVVSDGLGTLYNKDAVLSHLLAESQKEAPTPTEILQTKKEAFKDRLRGLRDVVEVKFQHASSSDGSTNTTWICPITNKPLGPGTKAIYIVPCGHAFAESLLSTVPGDRCLECDSAYEPENIIPILPTSDAAKDRLTQRLETLRAKGLTHSLKKAPKDSSSNGGSNSKKRKKAGPADASGPAPIGPPAGPPELPLSSVAAAENPTSGIKNKDTAALTERVLKEQEDRNKRRKMAGNQNVQSLFTKGDTAADKQVDFMTRGFSIPATSAKR